MITSLQLNIHVREGHNNLAIKPCGCTANGEEAYYHSSKYNTSEVAQVVYRLFP